MANDFKTEEQMSIELEEAKKLVQVGGKYSHYKHPEVAGYQVVGIGLLESTESVCVIYKRIDTGWLWVRTLEDFTSKVTIEGKNVNRFELRQ